MTSQLIKNHEDGFKKRQRIYPDLFDLENWRKSESYALIKKYCNKNDSIIEIGTLTGHHILLLAQEEYWGKLVGIDFVKDAIDWANEKKEELGLDNKNIIFNNSDFLKLCFHESDRYSKIILFDVIEHVSNLELFLNKVISILNKNGEVLILVPKGREYFDPCHINFYPDEDCLRNLLQLYFEVIEAYEVEHNNKIFARCKLKNE